MTESYEGLIFPHNVRVSIPTPPGVHEMLCAMQDNAGRDWRRVKREMRKVTAKMRKKNRGVKK